eukprot:g43611.t1
METILGRKTREKQVIAVSGSDEQGLQVVQCLQIMKDVVALERVQKRVTGMLPSMEGISYEERLGKLGLFSLERWKLRGDLIEVYKIMKGMDRVDSQRLFPR